MNTEDIIDRLYAIVEEKLDFYKLHIATQLDEGRITIVKARVRGGKIQRKKKVATQPGYTIRGGKLVRMSSKERMDRKMGARKGKVKRKAKLARALIKRKKSLRKRASIGL